ncbi:MAG TPA: hypothetical protein VHE37_12250 [Nevskiaceae bacterium]|nr:hypothetical protein [Nevskiaceae bacterium]
MNKHSVLILTVLALCACGKHEAPAPQPEAPKMAEHVDAVPQTTPAESAQPAEAPPAINGEEVSINEPMPPVDEEGAPPIITAQGKCQGAAGATVSGDVTIYDAGSGSRLLRIENLKSPGGTTDIGLVTSNAPTTADLSAIATLGSLKGASGNMNYLVDRKLALSPPRALALAAHDRHELIGWCSLVPPKADAGKK